MQVTMQANQGSLLPKALDAIGELSSIIASTSVADRGRVRLVLKVHDYTLNGMIELCFEVVSKFHNQDEQTVCYLFNELDQATKYYEAQIQRLA